MSNTYTLEDKDGYHLLSNLDLEAENFRDILNAVSESLNVKKQNVVLSLSNVRALYSSHLAVFVRLHQLIQKNGNLLIIADISPEIKNLLQITQLDSIFSVYETLNNFLGMQNAETSRASAGKNDFEWSISNKSDDYVKVICSGNMVCDDSLNELQKSIIGFFSIEFDFSKLNSIDGGSSNMVGKLADNHSVSVSGASSDLLEKFKQEHIYGKVKLL